MQLKLHMGAVTWADEEICVYDCVDRFEIPFERTDWDTLEIDDRYPPERVAISFIMRPVGMPIEKMAAYRRQTLLGQY